MGRPLVMAADDGCVGGYPAGCWREPRIVDLAIQMTSNAAVSLCSTSSAALLGGIVALGVAGVELTRAADLVAFADHLVPVGNPANGA